MKEEVEDKRVVQFSGSSCCHSHSRSDSFCVIRCPLRLVQMFSMCECRPGCSGRCLLQLPRSAFHPSEKKKKKKYLRCGARPEGSTAKFLPPQQTASPATNSLFNNKDSQKRGRVLITLHAASIVSTSVSASTPGKACAHVCANLCVFHDTFLQSDRPHSCHCLAEREKKKSLYPQRSPQPHNLVHSTQVRAQKSH